MSNRKLITNSIVADLKKINKSTSPYNYSYEFKTDLHNNVYDSGYKYIDEINDFPSVYVVSGLERRIYQTKQLTESLVRTAIRCYVYGDDAQQQTNDIIQDIEHVIYNMKPDVGLLIQDITVKEILTDSGLLEPYGMAEIFLNTRFEIYNN
jgi:hypothetical protein